MSEVAFEKSLKDGDHFRDKDRTVPARVSRPPEPGSESAGPSLFNLVQETRKALEVQGELLKNAIGLLDKRIVVDYATGQTDANGNLDLKIYTVPMGMQFLIDRVNIEDGTHTPGNGFTAAGCWLALMRGDKWQPGSIIDFLPNPPNANGVILPALFSDGPGEAGIFRGGEIIGLHIVGTVTLANTDIWVRIQGMIEPV